MHVATVPTYEEMWVHPAIVAALSDGMYTYTPALPWDPLVTYEVGEHVLAGECPFDGCIYTALQSSIGIDPTTNDVVWDFNEALTGERLRLYTATTQATWLLDTLTGYRLHGYESWLEDYRVQSSTITLRRQPVAAVTSVKSVHRCNQIGEEISGWCWSAANQVSLACSGGQPIPWYPGYIDPYYSGGTMPRLGCGCDDNVVRVAYDIESNLPPGSEGLVAWIAVEYGKAAAGQACALPERISNVTRQGVSWTILDPQDFLDKGYTGMSRVDNWLAPLKMTLGGRIIDPLRSTRLFSQRQDRAPAEPIPPPASGYGASPYGTGPYGGSS